MNQTVKTKIPVPLIGKLAVKHKFITKEQLKRTLMICKEAEREGQRVTLPEIFIRTEVILPEEMKKLHQIVADYGDKQQPPPSDSEPFSIRISEDKLKAELIVAGELSPDTTTETVLDKMKSMGIKFGIVKDYFITNHLNNESEHGQPKLIAKGAPVFCGEPPVIECFFNADYFRNEAFKIDSKTGKEGKTIEPIEEGDLLLEKTAMIPSGAGINVFGEEIAVDPLDDIEIRAGVGAELFEEEMKIFAASGGLPFLSVDGRVNVFQTVTIDGDYGVASGPVERASNLVVEGIVTGEYPVRGGSISAAEIRDASIDVLGDITVDIGITGSVIRCEGDVRAKYIHGSVIETYGSVITEKEILDSTITTSGICRSIESKIIASVVSAKRGVRAAGVGTRTSVPCEITLGKDVQCANTIQRIEARIEKNRELVAELKDKSVDFTQEQSSVNQKIVALMDQHKQLNQAIAATENNIAVLKLGKTPEPFEKAKKTLLALKKKYTAAVSAIRKYSDMLQGIGDELNKIPEEIVLKEKENKELELDKKFIADWEKKNEPIGVLEVNGEIAAGTVVAGINTFDEMKRSENVRVTEKPVKGSDPPEWQIAVRSMS